MRSLPLVVALMAGLGLASFACVGDSPATVGVAPDGGAAEDGATPPDGAAPPDGGGNDAAITLGALTIDPAIAVVGAGKTAEVTVNLERKNVVAGDVVITAEGLPAGVTATAPPIPANSTSTKLTLSAAANATVGDATMKLTAPNVAAFEPRLVVAGAPGTADTAFDADGIVLETSAPQASARGLALQADGKIIAVGTNGTGWLVRRYDDKGVADATFNAAAAGAVPSTGMARAVAIDPATQKITIVGGSVAGATYLTVVRLNGNGSADQAFGSAGTMRMSSVDHSGGSDGYAVAVVGAETIVAGRRLGPERAMLEKLSATGARAASFTPYAGAATTNFSALALLASGAIVATGTEVVTNPPKHFAARFLANGSADATFNGGTRTYTSGCRANGGAMVSDGDMVIVGSDVTSPSFCETRFEATAAGNLVFTRKTAGGGSQDELMAAAAADFANSVAVGHGGGTQDRFARLIVRRRDGALSNALGSIDFEDPGSPDTFRDRFFAVVSTPDGRFLIGGERQLGTTGLLLRRIWR